MTPMKSNLVVVVLSTGRWPHRDEEVPHDGVLLENEKERGFSSKQNTLFNTFITVLHHRTTSSVGHNNWMGVLVVIWVRVSYCEWCEEGTMMHRHILLQHFKR